MTTELHDRLEYLVNYSSQLIFVSGDSVAQQQRSLEAFVFKQRDDTEIAFVTADPEKQVSDYRRLLCQQLLGQRVGSYIRPLNELLAELNQQTNPVLITITQAEHLPKVFLQELWDLVLQSRFAANKLHLNVLVFGHSEWAEKTKQWLPSRNTDTPLLISSQSIIAEEARSDVEQMLAKRRAEFHDYLQDKYGKQTNETPLIRSRMFIAFSIILLLGSFIAVFSWQHKDDIMALFSPITSNSDTANADPKQISVPGSAYDKLFNPEKQQQVEESSLTKPSDPPRRVELVADWPSTAQQQNNVHLPEIVRTQADVPADYSPQGISASQVEAQSLTTEALSQEEPHPLTDESLATQSEQMFDKQDIENDTEDKADNSFPDDRFMVQLAGMKDKELLQTFVEEQGLVASTTTYTTLRYGGEWHVLLLKPTFGSIEEAKQHVAKLPEFAGKQNAFVKSTQAINDEISKLSLE